MIEQPASFVLGDWGTSNLRLSCVVDGKIVDTTAGPGVGKLKSNAKAIIVQAISHWEEKEDINALYLCGMAGSSLGLVDVPHHPCPTYWAEIGRVTQSVSLGAKNAQIVPGLSCINPLDAPDYLRGEETQIVGALKVQNNIRRGSQLLCLCGTHTKWAWITDGRIDTFLTSLSGELFEQLRLSVLVEETADRSHIDAASLRLGIQESGKQEHADLLHQLFQVRSRVLSGELSTESASGFLSGLILGTDVGRALKISRVQGRAIDSVTIVGAEHLTKQYARACSYFKTKCTRLDGQTASLAGLASIFNLDISLDSHGTN